MLLGALFIAIISGACVSAVLFFHSWPIWIVLISYPVVGAAVLLAGLFMGSMTKKLRPERSGLVQSPVPRSTTPTVATSNLRSVAHDNSRS